MSTTKAVGKLHTAIVCPHCGKHAMLSGDYRGSVISCVFQACGKSIEIVGAGEPHDVATETEGTVGPK